MTNITLNINGTNHEVSFNDPEMPLLWVLRDIIGLTGTKYGCGIEVCGACTVLIDGRTERSCSMNATSAVGRTVTTIEGLSPNRSHPAQLAWIKHQVPQCGYCQSGVLLSVANAMSEGHLGAEALSELPNLCVCGTYQRMREAAADL